MATKTPARKPEYIPTWRLEEINRAKGFYFFSADTRRGFASRIGGDGWLSADGKRAYFVTSEQFRPLRGTPDPRRYTVRVMDMETAKINDVGGFQAYAKGSTANAAAKYAASQDA